jgi:hypothetical protein
MYGLGHRASAKYQCIYCSQERNKPEITTTEQALLVFNKKKKKCETTSWEGGLFSSHIPSKPVIGAAAESRWKPIFAIPMTRVHMCTLHAFNRIIEKIVHLHFQFIWTIRDKVMQKQAIEDMQKVVSSTGAHGGNVIIFKDDQLSGKKNNVPNKPSFNGKHASNFFKKSSLPGGSDPLYKDVVAAEKNYIGDGESRRAKLVVWKGLETLLPYLSGLTLTDDLIESFPSKLEDWGRQYVEAFGETHVTHYIVSPRSLFLFCECFVGFCGYN